MDDLTLTDEEVCKVLDITIDTLRRLLRVGPSQNLDDDSASETDIRKIRHLRVGSKRLWLKSSVEQFLCGEQAAAEPDLQVTDEAESEAPTSSW